MSSYLQTGDGACGHPTALFARPGVCTHAHCTEGITGSEGREGGNGVEAGSESGVGKETGMGLGRERGREQ